MWFDCPSRYIYIIAANLQIVYTVYKILYTILVE